MNQKFANLGTMLSRTQAKKIVGGAEEEYGSCTTHCYAWNASTMHMDYLACTYIQGTSTIPGFCDCPSGTNSCS